jgi:hypothetical protein
MNYFRGFMKRNPDLSQRKPESSSSALVMGFNKIIATKFLELLGGIIDQYQLTPDRICNCDETGISTFSKLKSKIISGKGRKQVGALSSAEQGTLRL